MTARTRSRSRQVLLMARCIATAALLLALLLVLSLDLFVCLSPGSAGTVMDEVRTDWFGTDVRFYSVSWSDAEATGAAP